MNADIASQIKSQAYGRSSFKQTMLVTDATEQMVQIEFSKLTRGIQNSCKVNMNCYLMILFFINFDITIESTSITLNSHYIEWGHSRHSKFTI